LRNIQPNCKKKIIIITNKGAGKTGPKKSQLQVFVFQPFFHPLPPSISGQSGTRFVAMSPLCKILHRLKLPSHQNLAAGHQLAPP